jgi:hypothetical protein
MLRRPLFAVFALAALALTGCAKQKAQLVEALAPSETFDWCDAPVTFRPPQSPWTPDGFGDGGLKGIWYVKKGSVGEAITVAEHRLIAERDQRKPLRELLDELPRLDQHEIPRKLSLARWRTDLNDPLSRAEGDAATSGNEAIDRALNAHFDNRPDDVRWEIDTAMRIADRTHLTLDDVLARVEFRPEQRNDPKRYTITGRKVFEVAGEKAVSIDYTIDLPEGRRWNREVYVMHDNHLFVARFIGLEQNLPLFDRVVATLSFDAPPQVANAR